MRIKSMLAGLIMAAIPTAAFAEAVSGSAGNVHAGPVDLRGGTITSTTGSELDIGGACTVADLGTKANGLCIPTAVELQAAVIPAVATISDTATLDADDCGITQFVTAGIDTKTITLPATIAGCKYEFIYTGADGGALLDISPAAADAIHGSCTLAASVLEFNGTDDNDIGLTKATANTADRITLVGDGTAGWYVSDCAGIWANN